VIAHDAAGEPALCARWYLPEAFTPGTRITHDERSFALCLGGEVALYECDPDERVLVKEGYWIDRRPGSEYRFGPDATPRRRGRTRAGRSVSPRTRPRRPDPWSSTGPASRS
jgi:hypothetical protein